ncbi:MAG: exodeoxyribonuclease V subunit alpha, partial [Opitutales bacterium]|nr:exodeoxyribonuclease V subunit alpha [Opitutales bacterium]
MSNPAKQNRCYVPAAEWLSEEIIVAVKNLGVGKDEADHLGALVFSLAKTTAENQFTHLKIQSGADLNFLKNASASPPLCRLTGTEKTFSEGKITPLILDTRNSALYFFRHYKQEVETATRLISRSEKKEDLSKHVEPVIAATLPFPLNSEQQEAVRTLLSRALTIISGGPGTGKTTLLLRALLCLFIRNPDAKVLLAAPTGKAAGRMKESLRSQIRRISETPNAKALFSSGVLRKIERIEPTTLHRMLKTDASLLTRRDSPLLSADYVIVDEASMVDQAMMHRLLCALNPHSSLVLLGDKNQLDSVGAGRVFGAICAEDALASARIELRESRRFSEQGLLGRLARNVVSGETSAAESLLANAAAASDSSETFCFSPGELTPQAIDDALSALFPEKIKNTPENAEPNEMLGLIDSVRFLTPLRNGRWGTEQINARARRLFAPAGTSTETHFHGQPILITQNAPRERLFNGDVGIILREKDTGTLTAYFHGENEEIRRLPASLLPPHETAYAMSIHKSQGSEFSRLCVIFPPEGSHEDFFSRQLLYTAITRFREGGDNSRFHLLFDPRTLLDAIRRENPVRELLFLHAS